ncbi:MAG TPA: ABC transporter permease [Candidatus Binataceae bacterium]
MFQRLRQMLVKEFIQVFRDPRQRFGLIAPPIIQMIIFGYAATFEVRHVATAIVDLDHSQESRDLIARFTSNGHFDVRAHPQNNRQIAELIDDGKVILAIQIHPGFAENLRKGQTAPVQVILDGTNSNTALVALGYINQIAADYAVAYQTDMLNRTQPSLATLIPTVSFERRPWYNANLDSMWFFVPGTIGTITLTLIVTLTAFSVVREREIGTLEQIMVTPISRAEFILGKTIPFFCIGFGQVTLISLLGTLWFRVPFRGELWLMALGSALFIISMLGVGLFISTVSSTQQQAMVAAFFFVTPAITLSGFSFPISSMPELFQWLTYINPLRYFLEILRGIYLKGNGIALLWPDLAALLLIGVVLLSVDVQRFHKSLE